jgi:hypothetical protein
MPSYNLYESDSDPETERDILLDGLDGLDVEDRSMRLIHDGHFKIYFHCSLFFKF